MRKILIAASAAFLLSASAVAQHVNATLLQNWIRTSSSSAHSDVWGYTAPDGKEFAIIGERSGISILDATDPKNVQALGYYPVSAFSFAWRDYTNIGRFIYAVSEHHRGMRVFEIQANGTPRDHGFIQTAQITSAHNIRADPATGYLYVVGGNNRGMAIFDASANPLNPTFLAVWNTNYIHDACIRRGKAYICTGSSYQTRIMDITNPLSIPQIGTCPTAAGYNHSAWVSEDDKLLCICNEIPRNGVTPHMEVWDVSNPAQPRKRGDYDPGNGAIAHNVFVMGRTAYMSYYGEGVHLIDLTDPTSPTKVASYKTTQISSTGYYGTWGVFPFQDSGVIYASDMQGGFFTIQFDCGHMNRFGPWTEGNGGARPQARFDGATPRVGASTLRLEIEQLTPNEPFWIAVSGASLPAPTTVLGAELNVDLNQGLVFGPFTAAGDGSASQAIGIPNDPNLANQRVYMQVFSSRGNGSLSATRGMWTGICQ